jgi:hypothetical protein
MTGTNCDLFTHKSSRSCLNHLVYKFEAVFSFSCSGSEIDYKRDKSVEIKRCILSASKRFRGLKRLLKAYILSRKTKLLLYKVLRSPVLRMHRKLWC